MPDQEKITINMSAVDLGKIDLLVQESLYSNRTDFIRTAIRNLLDKHNVEIQQSVTRNAFAIGAMVISRADLERHKAKGEKINFTLIGLLHLASDITPELARAVIETVTVRGVFNASAEVKAALSDRIK